MSFGDETRKKWVLDILTKARIFFPSPRLFNDPFDCKILHVEHNTNDYVWRKDLYRIATKFKPEMSRQQKREWSRNIIKQGRHRDPEIVRSIFGGLQQRIDKHGVLCLSSVPDNILMWSHYADSHKGICLEFDANNNFFARASPVTYSDQCPCERFPAMGNFNVDIFYTKSKLWSYEKEWRIFEIEGGNKFYSFRASALTSVICGFMMHDDAFQELKKAIQHLINQPRLYRARHKAGGYELEIEPS